MDAESVAASGRGARSVRWCDWRKRGELERIR